LQREARYTFVSEIASRYGRRLLSFFTQRLRNRADAPDLAQEVFLRLMRVETSWKPSEARGLSLPRLQATCCTNITLRQASTPASIDISEVSPNCSLLPMTIRWRVRMRSSGWKRFDRLLAQLPPKVSSTLLLHRFGALTH